MDTISTQYLRRNLPEIWPRVDGGGESFEVTYHGRVVFRIVPAKGFGGVIPGLRLPAGLRCGACGASGHELDVVPCTAEGNSGRHQVNRSPE